MAKQDNDKTAEASQKEKEEKKDKNTTNQEEQDAVKGEKEEQPKAEKEASEEENKVEKLERELAESKDKHLRLYSEFENFRRRTAKEKIDFMQTANESLIKELLGIIDDYERAEATFNIEERKDDPVLEGFEIIMSKFKKLLEKQGLKAMEDAKGNTFDTEVHEAVTQYPAPSDDMKGKVIDQLEKGYFLHEKVIRYAKVVVGA